jgi:hypothetical protein
MDKPKHCCEDFAKALRGGTDYGPLIVVSWCGEVGTYHAEWDFTRSAVEPIRFCPWCGKPPREASNN